MVRGRAPRPLTPWQASPPPRAQPKGPRPFRMWSCWGAGFLELGNLAAQGHHVKCSLARHSLQQAQLDCGVKSAQSNKNSQICLACPMWLAKQICPPAFLQFAYGSAISKLQGGCSLLGPARLNLACLGVAARGHLCFSGWGQEALGP